MFTLEMKWPQGKPLHFFGVPESPSPASTRVAADAVADAWRQDRADLFASGGRGLWSSLKASTKRAKRRRGHSPKVNVATRRLRNSVADKNHRDHIYRPTAGGMTIGTSTPYGAYVNARRPFLRASPDELLRYGQIYIRHIAGRGR